MSDDGWLDATDLASLIRNKHLKPAEVVEAAVERIATLNPRINSVIHPLFDKARFAVAEELPAGPFTGVPLLLKDLGATSAGDPYHEGTKFLRDAGWRGNEDSFVVQRFRRAGFVIVGRTNVPELGSAPTTEPEAFGPTRNPWDLDRSAGGSSGGSAAAVASGMVPIAHGNDGGGSIRIPASMCGLVGLKPSRGRVPWGPAPDSPTGFATHSVLTRSVRDTAAVLDVVAGAAPGEMYAAPNPGAAYATQPGVDPGRLRIGILAAAPASSGGGGVVVQPVCREAAEATAFLLEGLGHAVEPAWPSALDALDVTDAMATVTFSGLAHALDVWGERLGRQLGPDDVNVDNWAMADAGRAIAAPSLLAALDALHGFRREVLSWWAEGFDLLVTPTLAEPPPMLGFLASDPAAPFQAPLRALPFSVFTTPFNITGQPAISLPMAWDAGGLPIGVQLVADYGREDLLLQVAASLEREQPWAHRHPALVS